MYRGTSARLGTRLRGALACRPAAIQGDHCYAFQLHDQRFKGQHDAARQAVATDEILTKHLHDEGWPETAARLGLHGAEWAAEARRRGLRLPLPPQYDRPFSEVQLLDEKRLTAPLRARKPHAYFVDSMSDLFHEEVPDAFLDEVFGVMALAPQHLFMILTKRPERMREYMHAEGRWERIKRVASETTNRVKVHGSFTLRWPLKNVWLGFSAEDQQRFDERWPHVRDTPAAVRFVSMEPLLDGIDARRTLEAWECAECGYHPAERGVWSRPRRGCPICSEDKGDEGRIVGKRHLDWVIMGGESGSHARPFDLAWARNARDQCAVAGVPFFMKQLGAHPVVDLYRDEQGAEFPTGHRIPLRLRNRHGADMTEWPEDLRVREFPAVGG